MGIPPDDPIMGGSGAPPFSFDGLFGLGVAQNLPPNYRMAMNLANMPTSGQIVDNRNAPPLPLTARAMLDIMSRELNPYGGRLPQYSQRRATPPAIDAGIRDIDIWRK